MPPNSSTAGTASTASSWRDSGPSGNVCTYHESTKMAPADVPTSASSRPMALPGRCASTMPAATGNAISPTTHGHSSARPGSAGRR